MKKLERKCRLNSEIAGKRRINQNLSKPESNSLGYNNVTVTYLKVASIIYASLISICIQYLAHYQMELLATNTLVVYITMTCTHLELIFRITKSIN